MQPLCSSHKSFPFGLAKTWLWQRHWERCDFQLLAALLWDEECCEKGD